MKEIIFNSFGFELGLSCIERSKLFISFQLLTLKLGTCVAQPTSSLLERKREIGKSQ
jgi:hypothetical protein